MVLNDQKRNLRHTARIHDQQHRCPRQDLLRREPRRHIPLDSDGEGQDRSRKTPRLDLLPAHNADDDDRDVDEEDEGGVDVREEGTAGIGADVGGAVEGVGGEGEEGGEGEVCVWNGVVGGKGGRICWAGVEGEGCGGGQEAEEDGRNGEDELRRRRRGKKTRGCHDEGDGH